MQGDDENGCLVGMEESLKDVNIWMCKNRLQMNNGKTEFIYDVDFSFC